MKKEEEERISSERQRLSAEKERREEKQRQAEFKMTQNAILRNKEERKRRRKEEKKRREEEKKKRRKEEERLRGECQVLERDLEDLYSTKYPVRFAFKITRYFVRPVLLLLAIGIFCFYVIPQDAVFTIRCIALIGTLVTLYIFTNIESYVNELPSEFYVEKGKLTQRRTNFFRKNPGFNHSWTVTSGGDELYKCAECDGVFEKKLVRCPYCED